MCVDNRSVLAGLVDLGIFLKDALALNHGPTLGLELYKCPIVFGLAGLCC